MTISDQNILPEEYQKFRGRDILVLYQTSGQNKLYAKAYKIWGSEGQISLKKEVNNKDQFTRELRLRKENKDSVVNMFSGVNAEKIIPKIASINNYLSQSHISDPKKISISDILNTID